MSRTYLEHCAGVPAPTSPISHAVVVGGLCWISGQHALNAAGAYEGGTAEEEARRCFELVARIAHCAGFSTSEIAYVDVSFVDLADLPAVNQVFEELFRPGQRPTRTISQAAALAFGARLKVSAVAARSS